MVWNWFSRDRPSRTIQASQRALNNLEDSARRLKRLEKLLLKLEKDSLRLATQNSNHVERAKSIAEEIAEGIKIAERSVQQAEQAMEVLRTEHEADTVAVETLTGRIKEYQALSEANIALSHHQRGQMAPGSDQM